MTHSCPQQVLSARCLSSTTWQILKRRSWNFLLLLPLLLSFLAPFRPSQTGHCRERFWVYLGYFWICRNLDKTNPSPAGYAIIDDPIKLMALEDQNPIRINLLMNCGLWKSKNFWRNMISSHHQSSNCGSTFTSHGQTSWLSSLGQSDQQASDFGEIPIGFFEESVGILLISTVKRLTWIIWIYIYISGMIL